MSEEKKFSGANRWEEYNAFVESLALFEPPEEVVEIHSVAGPTDPYIVIRHDVARSEPAKVSPHHEAAPKPSLAVLENPPPRMNLGHKKRGATLAH